MSFEKIRNALESAQLSQHYFDEFKDKNVTDSMVQMCLEYPVGSTAHKLISTIIPDEQHRSKFNTAFKTQVNINNSYANSTQQKQQQITNGNLLVDDLRLIRLLISKYKVTDNSSSSLINFDSWLAQLQKLETDVNDNSLLNLNHELGILLDSSQLTDLAYELRDREMYREALELYEKIHSRQNSTLGPDHETTLYTQFQIATCLGYLKEYNKALDYYKIVFEKRNIVLGPNHEGTVRTQHNIALIFQEQGKYDEALQLYEQLYAIRHSTLGEDHTDTIKTQFQMALCFDDLKDYDKALELYGLVFTKRNDILGPNHRDTWLAQQNMAWVLQNQLKFKEALDLYEKVYEKKTKFLGNDHPSTLHTKRCIECVSKSLKK